MRNFIEKIRSGVVLLDAIGRDAMIAIHSSNGSMSGGMTGCYDSDPGTVSARIICVKNSSKSGEGGL